MTKVIAELGINHFGDYTVAKDLISEARKAGAWGIKFQYRNLGSAYAGGAAEIGDEIVRRNISRSFLEPKQILDLTEYAREIGLRAGISFFNQNDVVDFGRPHFDFYKIPSAELTNHPLIQDLLGFGNDVLVSTGMHSETEIESLANALAGNQNLVLLHCVSNYPTESMNAKLGYITWLRDNYPFRVGYSSHDKEWATAVLALPLGIDFLERHLTLDKKQPGTDQSSSSEPEELRSLVSIIDNYGLISSGNGPRNLNQGEKINRQNLGRSLYANQDLVAGEVVSRDYLSYVSPQVGLNWSEWSDFADKPLLLPVSAGEPLSMRHFSNRNVGLKQADLVWAKQNLVALPVRLHDFHRIHSIFGLDAYEFHLSYGEIEQLTSFQVPEDVSRFSVHMPDYAGSDDLVDPFSVDSSLSETSKMMFQKVSAFARNLADRAQSTVVVVCSLSDDSRVRSEFYDEVAGYFRELSEDNVTFSLQWLPPYAWYFGGSVRLQRMNSLDDLPFLIKSSIPVTMDLSHLLMGEHAGLYSAEQVVEQLKDNIVHFHLSGATGIDGEGHDFDFSNETEESLVGTVFGYEQTEIMKVLEVWQGHLDDFEGFKRAVSSLAENFRNG